MEELTFENASSELESIIKKIEQGNLSLQEGTNLFERASFLAEFCSKKLEESKGKITVIREKLNNIIEEELN